MAIAYDSQTVQVGQWASVACTEDYLPFVCKKLPYGASTAAITTVSQGKCCRTKWPWFVHAPTIAFCIYEYRCFSTNSVIFLYFRAMRCMRDWYRSQWFFMVEFQFIDLQWRRSQCWRSLWANHHGSFQLNDLYQTVFLWFNQQRPSVRDLWRSLMGCDWRLLISG